MHEAYKSFDARTLERELPFFVTKCVDHTPTIPTPEVPLTYFLHLAGILLHEFQNLKLNPLICEISVVKHNGS